MFEATDDRGPQTADNRSKRWTVDEKLLKVVNKKSVNY